MNLLWLFLIVVAASVAVGLLVAGLQRWADRTPHSDLDDPDTVVEPVKRTEEERAALWAELASPTAELLAVQRADHYTATVLDGIERTVHQGLERLLSDVYAQLGQDPIDVELAQLCAGELVNA